MKTCYNTLMAFILVVAMVQTGPAFAESASTGKGNEPEVQGSETEKTPAKTNMLKEAFKKLVGKDEEKKAGEETAVEKSPPSKTKKAESEPEPETGEKKESTNILKETFKKLVGKKDDKSGESGDIEKAETKPEAGTPEEEKPKDGIIKKAFKTLIKNKEETEQAKEEAEEKAAKLKDAAKEKKVEAEAQAESSEEKTKASAKKFISQTIDKIVETVKGDDKKELEDEPKQAKVETKSKTDSTSKVEATGENKEEEKGEKSSNPLKEAFKKLVGDDDTKKKEEGTAVSEKP
ncbi:exported hypothetical protein [Nitrospina gracilis 3/211]|uniref:Uncharacterized protein n=1 Tax=Nitrospina gracilis (strain 3/211) TaxID=1266370 RepID=M1Z364_NITG3|nr:MULTISPECIES: hypothetical protein [Nitrospina]MCF8722513.1 DNA polymerase III gamma/tau subunit [Nitrospina sp. Nb-3]CCQ91945.1 exported hypothetical protein [Nitrospina gracilis 3/211]